MKKKVVESGDRKRCSKDSREIGVQNHVEFIASKINEVTRVF